MNLVEYYWMFFSGLKWAVIENELWKWLVLNCHGFVRSVAKKGPFKPNCQREVGKWSGFWHKKVLFFFFFFWMQQCILCEQFLTHFVLSEWIDNCHSYLTIHTFLTIPSLSLTIEKQKTELWDIKFYIKIQNSLKGTYYAPNYKM